MAGFSGAAGRVALAVAALVCLAAAPAAAKDLFVAPKGAAKADGSKTSPFGKIGQALAAAQPGDRIVLAPGRYAEDVKTVRDGRAGAPITVTGPASARIVGSGGDRVFVVNHDHIHLEGFTLDGKVGDASSKKGFRDKLLYVIGRAPGRGVNGLVVTGLTVRNAGGECIRLRYLVRGALVANNRIGPCGAYDFRLKDGGKNGEGIYIGTGPEQRGKNGAPDGRVDASNGNRIAGNVIDTRGNECVDIKEGSSGNIVEGNDCTGQRDKESAGLDSRGDRNVFRNNRVHGNRGAGIRFGGDKDGMGVGNEAYGNVLADNKAGGFALQRGPQGRICDNTVTNSDPLTFGRFRGYADPTASCASFAWKKPEKKDDEDKKEKDDDD